MLRPLCCLLLCSASVLSGQIDPDGALAKIRRHVMDSIQGLPNYLCTETVNREMLALDSFSLGKADVCGQIVKKATKSPNAFELLSSDRLRLDVAMIGGKEMYSWVGEGRFNDVSLSDLVKQGTTSTGSFGSYLVAIFGSDAAQFTFKGDSAMDGRKVLEYAFDVPITRSRYVITNQGISRVTDYGGTFTADAQTFDLLRLEVRTGTLAKELQMCQSATILDYARVSMNNVSVFLPSEANVRILATDGQQSHNRIVFSGCHQFLGESKLILDEAPAPADSPVAPAAKSKAIVLPAGLKVAVALAESIDPATAAAGDPVTGQLTQPIYDQASGLTIPKGVKVRGRILEIRLKRTASDLEFGLKWESFELAGANQPLDLLLARSGKVKLPFSGGRWPEVHSMSRPEQRGAGFFVFPQVPRKYQIPAGLETEWTTTRWVPTSE